MMGFFSAHLCQRPNGLGGQETSPSTLVYSGEAHGSCTPCPWHSPPPFQLHLLLNSAWRSPAGEMQAPPPRRRAAGALPQILLSPCWIKKEQTSPGCTCVERGGAVHSALDRIFRDLNRHEYDSLIRVLVTLPHRVLQGYEDARPYLVARISID